MEDSVGLMRGTFPKLIEIEEILEKPLSMVNADAGQLSHVLVNLCINAKEAMPDGGKLRIETRNAIVDEEYCRSHPGINPGRHVLVEISDTGKGMIQETIERMFDPFYTTKGWDFNKGTGLGLSVAKGLVEQHRGWIICQSQLGVGTKFGVYVPRHRRLDRGIGTCTASGNRFGNWENSARRRRRVRLETSENEIWNERVTLSSLLQTARRLWRYMEGIVQP